MEFSRQEYWHGLPCLPPGNLPNPGIEPRSPALQADSWLSEPPGKPKNTRVGSLSLLQCIFLTQESNRGLLHCSGFFNSRVTREAQKGNYKKGNSILLYIKQITNKVLFLRFFFMMWTICKVFPESATILLLFFMFLVFLVVRHAVSWLPYQGWNLHILHWEVKS